MMHTYLAGLVFVMMALPSMAIAQSATGAPAGVTISAGAYMGTMSPGPTVTVPAGTTLVALNWTSVNATGCSIVGSPVNVGNGSNQPSSNVSGGGFVVDARHNNTYTVTCSNSYGSSSNYVTVLIAGATQSSSSISSVPGAAQSSSSVPLFMCGFKYEGGGIVCDLRSTNECSARGGIVFATNDDCWKQMTIVCGYRTGGGRYQCESMTQASCQTTKGTVYTSSEQCWKGTAPVTPALPSARYEDDVLASIEAYKNPFPDTDLYQLSGKAAAELYRRSVIGGFPDGQFKGGWPVNRAEAAKFLLLTRYAAVADVRNNNRFPDVIDGQWYTKFVITAANKGIISGYSDGTFGPANQVNAAEFLKMLSLTFGLQLHLSHSYSDVSASDWFAPYAGIAKKYNLFPGRSPKLSPQTPLTRQEVAIAIYQYLSNR